MTEDRNPYALANLADVTTPDSPESAGSRFLLGVADDVAEAIAYGRDSDDARHEIADGAVPVYTADVWQTFVDLAAWQEDISELADMSDPDMTRYAMVALYSVADRLTGVLFEEWDTERAELIAAAETLGTEHGTAAGSWVFDGNTSAETARDALRKLRDGDPAADDYLPSGPLSGEWADELTPDTLARTLTARNLDDDTRDEIADAYETAWHAAVAAEVERTAAVLAGE